MAKLSKKQRAALREISTLASERKRNLAFGYGAIAAMAVLIVVYNLLAYNLAVIDAGNSIMRAMLYITAMVLAGVSGINIMKASQKKSKIDGYRQSCGIARDTLDAWNKGEIE